MASVAASYANKAASDVVAALAQLAQFEETAASSPSAENKLRRMRL
jgi:hypothetical protein